MIPRIIITIWLTLVMGSAFSDCTKSDIDQLEKKLSSFKTLSLDFIEGNKTGVISIQKPGMMRIDYNKPEKISIIVADGVVTYYDYELDELTKIRQDPTFLTFLAKDRVNFVKDFETFACTIQDSHMTLLLSLHNEEGEKINLKMSFLQSNFNKVEILLHNNKKTVLFFKNITYNQKLDANQFNFRDKSFYNID